MPLKPCYMEKNVHRKGSTWGERTVRYYTEAVASVLECAVLFLASFKQATYLTVSAVTCQVQIPGYVTLDR